MAGDYDIVFVVETWMSAKRHDALVVPPGYSIIRKDRADKRGGGILVLFKSCLTVVEVEKDTTQTIELLCIDLLLPKKSKFRFMCVYFAPSLSNQITFVKNLMSDILTFKDDYDGFYLLGDFNMPHINWESLCSKTKVGEAFLDFCIESALYQHVVEPTHKSGSLLDLLFCNDLSSRRISSVHVRPPLSTTCDHSVIEFILEMEDIQKLSSNTPLVRRYNLGNYEEINRNLLSINWNSVFANLNYNTQLIYDYFLKIVHSLMHQYIPTSKFKNALRQPKHIKKLANQKRKLHRILKKNKYVKPEYKKLSKMYDKAVVSWNDEIENRVCQNGNSKGFYKYANKKLQIFNSVPPLKSSSGDVATTDKEKADLLNRTFYEQFVKDDNIKLNLPKRAELKSEISSIFVDDDVIREALNHLSAKTSETPDGVPSFVLKKIGSAITPFLTMFFNLSLQSGCLPWQWKVAHVTPCYKKGNKNCPHNWRPVAQTSALCRLLEKVISINLIKHLSTNNLLSKDQHGFLPRRSTGTELLLDVNNWQEWFYAKENVEIVYTDLAKAFDKVSHEKLIEVLISYGIKGPLLNWTRNFLFNRKQFVKIQKSFSNSVNVVSGVPQGSVLGPLLFILYIDDLTKVISNRNKISLYADDTKIYGIDVSSVQSDLNAACQFFSDRQLELAPSKCEHLCLTKTNHNGCLYIKDKEVQQCTSVLDLGVTISSNLTWTNHVNRIRLKAFNKSQHILKSFTSNNVWTLLRAYTVYVRPIMESDSSVWNPVFQYDIDSLESVQRYYTRRICCRCNIPFKSYSDRLYKLNIKSLQYRRLEADMILVYKIINGLIDIPMNSLFKLYDSPYATRRHRFCLELKQCKSKNQQGLFSSRVCTIWNALPATIVEEQSFIKFRMLLKRFDLKSVIKFACF